MKFTEEIGKQFSKFLEEHMTPEVNKCMAIANKEGDYMAKEGFNEGMVGNAREKLAAQLEVMSDKLGDALLKLPPEVTCRMFAEAMTSRFQERMEAQAIAALMKHLFGGKDGEKTDEESNT